MHGQLRGIQDIRGKTATFRSFGFRSKFSDDPADILGIAHQDRLTVTDELVRTGRPARGHGTGDSHDCPAQSIRP